MHLVQVAAGTCAGSWRRRCRGRAFLPNAQLLVQRAELPTLAGLYPLQVEWCIPECLAGAPADRIVALDGDYARGGGFALVRTPGPPAAITRSSW